MSEIEMHADFLFVSYHERIFEFDFKEMKKKNWIWVVRVASYLPNSTTVIVHLISALIVSLALVTSYEGV